MMISYFVVIQIKVKAKRENWIMYDSVNNGHIKTWSRELKWNNCDEHVVTGFEGILGKHKSVLFLFLFLFFQLGNIKNKGIYCTTIKCGILSTSIYSLVKRDFE